MTTATATKSPAQEYGVAVGTIFYSSWGYDQTNVDFYVVTKVSPSGKSVTIRKCGAKLVEGKGLVANPETLDESKCYRCGNYHLQAEPNCWNGKPGTPELTKRIRGYNGKAVLSLTSYSNAYVWDGGPKFDTTALGYAGH